MMPGRSGEVDLAIWASYLPLLFLLAFLFAFSLLVLAFRAADFCAAFFAFLARFLLFFAVGLPDDVVFFVRFFLAAFVFLVLSSFALDVTPLAFLPTAALPAFRPGCPSSLLCLRGCVRLGFSTT